jgi:hypothetical protein
MKKRRRGGNPPRRRAVNLDLPAAIHTATG